MGRHRHEIQDRVRLALLDRVAVQGPLPDLCEVRRRPSLVGDHRHAVVGGLSPVLLHRIRVPQRQDRPLCSFRAGAVRHARDRILGRGGPDPRHDHRVSVPLRTDRHSARGPVWSGRWCVERSAAGVGCHAGNPLIRLHAAVHLLLRHRLRGLDDGDDDLRHSPAHPPHQPRYPTGSRGRRRGVACLWRTRVAGSGRRPASAGPARHHDRAQPDPAARNLHARHRRAHGCWRPWVAGLSRHQQPRRCARRIGRSRTVHGGRCPRPHQPDPGHRWHEPVRSHQPGTGGSPKS